MDAPRARETMNHAAKVETDVKAALEFLRVAGHVGVEGMDEPMRKLNWALGALDLVKAAIRLDLPESERGE